MAMDYLYHYEHKRDITDAEWAEIKEKIAKAFRHLCSTAIYKAIGDGNTKVGHWTSLFPPPPVRDNGCSIGGWVIDGNCLAFGGGNERSLRAEPFILAQKLQTSPQAHACFSDGCAYDLLVRYSIMIIHNVAPDAYHFTVNERSYEQYDIEIFWLHCADALADVIEQDIKIPFFTSKKGIWKRPLLIPHNWKQSIVGVDDSFF